MDVFLIWLFFIVPIFLAILVYFRKVWLESMDELRSEKPDLF